MNNTHIAPIFYLATLYLIIFSPATSIASYAIEAIQSHEYSHIVFLYDDSDKKYVLKQIVSDDVTDNFYLALEAFCYEVAQKINIPSPHLVHIVSPGVSSVGKKHDARPALLMSYVPGTSPWYNLQQKSWHGYSWSYLKPRPFQDTGLTRTVIRSMASHPHAAALVAYDTFIGNSDRGNNNLLYDEATDTLYAIDAGDAWRCDLGKEACMQLALLCSQGISFTQEERKALVCYHDMLKRLIKLYPSPELLIERLIAYALQCGFDHEELIDPASSIGEQFHAYRQIICNNHASCCALVWLLEKILRS